MASWRKVSLFVGKKKTVFLLIETNTFFSQSIGSERNHRSSLVVTWFGLSGKLKSHTLQSYERAIIAHCTWFLFLWGVDDFPCTAGEREENQLKIAQLIGKKDNKVLLSLYSLMYAMYPSSVRSYCTAADIAGWLKICAHKGDGGSFSHEFSFQTESSSSGEQFCLAPPLAS